MRRRVLPPAGKAAQARRDRPGRPCPSVKLGCLEKSVEFGHGRRVPCRGSSPPTSSVAWYFVGRCRRRPATFSLTPNWTHSHRARHVSPCGVNCTLLGRSAQLMRRRRCAPPAGHPSTFCTRSSTLDVFHPPADECTVVGSPSARPSACFRARHDRPRRRSPAVAERVGRRCPGAAAPPSVQPGEAEAAAEAEEYLFREAGEWRQQRGAGVQRSQQSGVSPVARYFVESDNIKPDRLTVRSCRLARLQQRTDAAVPPSMLYSRRTSRLLRTRASS